MISFNKKGAVFHFLLFIVLAALAIFFMYTRLGVVKSDVKGDWQVDFLEKNFPTQAADYQRQAIVMHQRLSE